MGRFPIRDLFWLTLVVALSVGWWANRQAMEAKHDEALNSLNAQVTADIAAGRLDQAEDRIKRFIEFREMMRGGGDGSNIPVTRAPTPDDARRHLLGDLQSPRASNQQAEAEDDFKIQGKVKVELIQPSSEVRLGSPAQ